MRAKLNRLKASPLGAVAGLLLLIAIVVQGYWAAGWIGAAIQAPGAEARAERGVAIFVEDNGVHTGIVLPKTVLPPALVARFAASDLANPRYARHEWVAIGWGDRAFYLRTPTWGDLSLATVANAGLGSDDVVLHVEHVPMPQASRTVRRVVLRPDQLRRLVGVVAGSLSEGAAVHGYGGWDAFYPARGHYNAITTCNVWTGAALATAGLPMGRWTPFSGTVMWWL